MLDYEYFTTLTLKPLKQKPQTTKGLKQKKLVRIDFLTSF